MTQSKAVVTLVKADTTVLQHPPGDDSLVCAALLFDGTNGGEGLVVAKTDKALHEYWKP